MTLEKKATNAERFALALKKNGVKYLFGQSNPQTITLACRELGIREIGYRQENAGTYMAQAYGMCSGSIPVVTAQNGPAATLLVPGLAECLKASHPIVALVDEVALNNKDRNAFQELDHLELFSGVSKWVKQVPSHERIEDYVDMAFTAAASGRPGPAVLLCPKDMTFDTNLYPVKTHRKESLGHYPLDRFMANPETIKEAAELLSNAENPLIYAGGGVISSEATEELRSIQQNCLIPVATTTMGKGCVDEKNELSIGTIGYYMGEKGSTKFLKQLVQKSDVILLVGNRTNENGTDGWTLLPQDAQYIHIDIDPTEIGRNYEALRLHGDAKLTLHKLEELLRLNLSKRESRLSELVKEIKIGKDAHLKELNTFLEEKRNERTNEFTVVIEEFLNRLDEKLDEDHLIASDASLSSVWLGNYVKAKGNRKFIFPRGLAGLGWGVPMAMGAKLANPSRKVFCLAGDGGFAHVWSELETCKRENINVVIVVINNRILAYQKLAEKSRWGKYNSVCDFANVDHTKVAEACGVKGLTIENSDQIDSVLNEAFHTEGPVLIDLITDPNSIPPLPFMEVLKGELE